MAAAALHLDSNIPPVATPTPPVFLSLGIPAANSPPSCGAASMAAAAGASLLPWSLLLLALLFPPPGTGGASPPGLAMPGTGGAPPRGEGPDPPEDLATTGAERSLVTVFFKARPLLMSARRAPYCCGACDATSVIHSTRRGGWLGSTAGKGGYYSLSQLLMPVGAREAHHPGEAAAAAALLLGLLGEGAEAVGEAAWCCFDSKSWLGSFVFRVSTAIRLYVQGWRQGRGGGERNSGVKY